MGVGWRVGAATPGCAQISQLCAQGSLLAEFRGPCGMLGITPAGAVCKARALPLSYSLFGPRIHFSTPSVLWCTYKGVAEMVE